MTRASCDWRKFDWPCVPLPLDTVSFGILAFTKLALLQLLNCGFDYDQTSRRTAENHVNSGSAVDSGRSTEIGKSWTRPPA